MENKESGEIAHKIHSFWSPIPTSAQSNSEESCCGFYEQSHRTLIDTFSFRFLLLCKVEVFPKAVTEKEKKNLVIQQFVETAVSTLINFGTHKLDQNLSGKKK